jgi:hypothetical protein
MDIYTERYVMANSEGEAFRQVEKLYPNWISVELIEHRGSWFFYRIWVDNDPL